MPVFEFGILHVFIHRIDQLAMLFNCCHDLVSIGVHLTHNLVLEVFLHIVDLDILIFDPLCSIFNNHRLHLLHLSLRLSL